MLSFWKQKKDDGTKDVDPRVGNAHLFANCPIPEFAKDSTVISRLEAISEQRIALSEALRRTRETIDTEQGEIERIDAQRVERLADLARFPRVNPETPADAGIEAERAAIEEHVESLRLSLEAKQRTVADAERTAVVLQGRITAFDNELIVLRQQYGVEVGKLLDAIFAHLAQAYMQAAPQLAELLVQIAAVQDVMMHFRSGNSNGFDRRAYLPSVEPGTTRSLAPLVDCSHGLSATTEGHRKDIIASLGAIGYRWRFDG